MLELILDLGTKEAPTLLVDSVGINPEEDVAKIVQQ